MNATVETYRTRTGRTGHIVSVAGQAIYTLTLDPRTGMYVGDDGYEFRSLNSARRSAVIEHSRGETDHS